MKPTTKAFRGGAKRNGKPYTDPELGGRTHAINAPRNEVKKPKYGPNKTPKTDASSASSLMVISGIATAGMKGEISDAA
jgi:hypothetical protein